MIGSKIIAGLAAMASAMQVTATSVQEFGTQFQRNEMYGKWHRAKTHGRSSNRWLQAGWPAKPPRVASAWQRSA